MAIHDEWRRFVGGATLDGAWRSMSRASRASAARGDSAFVATHATRPQTVRCVVPRSSVSRDSVPRSGAR
ncbi:hypothetical protein A4G86_06155 [Burkholderia pseudomallei]|nr:hypothetical protein A4G86_06155 [Burkholderia pseudomallei]